MNLRVPDDIQPQIGEVLSPDNVSAMVRAYAAEVGGLKTAGKRWGVTAQMVSLVSRGLRRPTDTMLETFGLKMIPGEPQYQRVRKIRTKVAARASSL